MDRPRFLDTQIHFLVKVHTSHSTRHIVACCNIHLGQEFVYTNSKNEFVWGENDLCLEHRDMVNIHQSRHSCLLQTAESLSERMFYFRVHWLKCQNRYPPGADPHHDPPKSSSQISKCSDLTLKTTIKNKQTNKPNPNSPKFTQLKICYHWGFQWSESSTRAAPGDALLPWTVLTFGCLCLLLRAI